MLYLVDKSVLARQRSAAVASALMPFLGQLAVCSTMLLEQGWSATSTAHYEQMMDDLSWWTLLPIDQTVLDRAVELQRRLVTAGQHRGPGVADLVLAATALTHEATVLHYDRDFDLIAEADAAFRHSWIVPRGSIG